MKLRVSSSCTVSRSSGQTAALWESSFCLVASSSTHSPNAKMSTERVYWFLGFVPAGSTSGCRQQHQSSLAWVQCHSCRRRTPARAGTGVGTPLMTSWCCSRGELLDGQSLHPIYDHHQSDSINQHCGSGAPHLPESALAGGMPSPNLRS